MLIKLADGLQAIQRIRDYFRSQIIGLRSPNVNGQIIQQRAFLPYRDLYSFMAKYQPRLADEMTLAYSNTMRWFYLSGFSRYKEALEKIPLSSVDKQDALGKTLSSLENADVMTGLS